MRDNIRAHCNEAIFKVSKDRWIGTFCQGSQNYGISDEHSDLDTKSLYLPPLDDFLYNKLKGGGTIMLPNDEHCVLWDIRTFYENLRKGSPNAVELLFTEICGVNPVYQSIWEELIAYREEIAYYNLPYTLKNMLLQIQGKVSNLKAKKTYPSRTYLLADFDYDPKELSHAIRLTHLMEHLIAGRLYADSLFDMGEDRELIIRLKREACLSYEEAVQLGQKYLKKAEEMVARFREEHSYWQGNPRVDKILTNTLKKFMKMNIEKELETWIQE